MRHNLKLCTLKNTQYLVFFGFILRIMFDKLLNQIIQMNCSKFIVLVCINFLISFVSNAQDYSDTYTVSSYGSMNQDGAMLSNVIFEVGATNSYRWDDASGAKKDDKLWKVIGSVSLKDKLNGSGYVYNGVLYPYNDFSGNGVTILPPETIEARIVLVNGFTKTDRFTMYSGAVLDGQSGEASVAHRLEDYQIQSVQIINTQDLGTERTIQAFLDKQARQRGNPNNANNSDAYGSEEKSSDNGVLSTSPTNSSTTNTTSTSSGNDNKYGIDSEEDLNDKSSPSREDRIRAMIDSDRIAREQKAQRTEQMVTEVADVATKLAGAFSEGIFTDLRGAINYRFSENVKDQNDNDQFTSMDLVTYDLGIGVGRSGFFSVGYGTPEYRDGYMYKVGIGFDVFSIAPTGGKAGRYGITLGVEGEMGFGSTETVEDERSDIVTEDGTIYGGAVTLRLFEILTAGIGYGFISSEENGPDGDFELKGSYTNYIIGLNIPF